MAKESTQQDRNFDDLAKRFKHNVYGGLKGDIRLAVLSRDCAEQLEIAPFHESQKVWTILDAGGGQGQFSLRLAQAGHRVVICDISAEMLKLAAAEVAALGLEDRVTLIHCALQDLARHLPQDLKQQLAQDHAARSAPQFDLVICHAVMEWLQEPKSLLPCLIQYLKPQGFLSLTFYNLHSLIYKNLLRTNFKKIVEQDYAGARGSLTPINPLDPQWVLGWLQTLPLKLLCHSGIRVFHDYIFNAEQREAQPETLIELELSFSRQEPYRSLGRYVHLLLQQSEIS
jgi:S-adenosylmethionine-dependent methyltransferase